jgi:hypothetical protein
METSQKGFISPLLLTLIALLLAGGAYVYVQNKQVNQSSTTKQTTEATSTALTPPENPPPPGWIPNLGVSTYLPDTVETQILPSATSTTVQVGNFSFTLSSVWHGKDTFDKGSSSHHIFLEKGSAFVIDCPPAGKGLEGVSWDKTESRRRTFVNNGMTYEIYVQKTSSSENDPGSYLVFVDSTPNSDRLCFVVGEATPEITEAIQDLYITWK